MSQKAEPTLTEDGRQAKEDVNDKGNFRTPYHYKWTALLYLNDEYNGGETLCEGEIIKPKKARLVIMDAECLHGVTIVEDYNRYMMPMWFTNLPEWYEHVQSSFALQENWHDDDDITPQSSGKNR